MVYRVDVLICGTAYIRASSPEEAQAILDTHRLEDASEHVSGLMYDDPELPEFSLSPAMTLYGKFQHESPIEEME
ncbi:MAG: hypothetical protein EOR77_21410 [Mesorhizobium sp.]|uniref:hypothetical protein n=1 Tax=Mesorhizobium sp. TaxID=1871066 RepID=UPI000FE5D24C|nr:hypothetical protein [Mesorhizobium sp.]RWM32591.1 MAG: hypothetical protein EOR77_21410 [Mesorhizobium sp.]